MSLVSDSMGPADIAAVTGNYGGNNGFGDGSVWIWVLFLFAFMGGWGNNNGNNGGIDYITYPFMGNTMQSGFDQAAVMAGINGITTGLTNGFANAEVSRCNGQTNVLQALNNNQANLTNQLNTIAMNQQNCCCENRAAVADLKYSVAMEACNDRAAVTDALVAVTAQNNANTQRILDKMCQQEIDALKTENANLQTRLTMANLAASQNAQTAAILTDNLAQTQALEQYLAPTPRPAYVVQNPNCCGQNFYGCGCGN